MSQFISTCISHGHTEKENSDDLQEGRLLQGTTHAVEEPEKHLRHGKRLKHTKRHQEDKLASALQDCLSLFRSGLLQDINIDNLVFHKPSQNDDPRIPPPLQSLATENTQFLQYQDWVKKLYLEAEKLDCGDFERCRSIKDELLGDLQNEWTKVEDLKRCSWQLVSQNAGLTMPPRPTSDADFAQGIDTCECQSHEI